MNIFWIFLLIIFGSQTSFSKDYTSVLIYSEKDMESWAIDEEVFGLKFSQSQENREYLKLSSCIFKQSNYVSGGKCTALNMGRYLHYTDYKSLSFRLQLENNRARGRVGFIISVVTLPVGGALFSGASKGLQLILPVSVGAIFRSTTAFLLSAITEALYVEIGTNWVLDRRGLLAPNVDPVCSSAECEEAGFLYKPVIAVDRKINLKKQADRIGSLLRKGNSYFIIDQIPASCSDCYDLKIDSREVHVDDPERTYRGVGGVKPGSFKKVVDNKRHYMQKPEGS